MDVTSRTGIISAIYKKGDKWNITNYRLISHLKFILLILKNQIQKTLITIIGEHQSKAIKNSIILL